MRNAEQYALCKNCDHSRSAHVRVLPENRWKCYATLCGARAIERHLQGIENPHHCPCDLFEVEPWIPSPEDLAFCKDLMGRA